MKHKTMNQGHSRRWKAVATKVSRDNWAATRGPIGILIPSDTALINDVTDCNGSIK
jgi:hypothetical protein